MPDRYTKESIPDEEWKVIETYIHTHLQYYDPEYVRTKVR